ncbi:MAG: sulfatase-like hydrolase/transferase, partial [Sedimentisphaerales bacterium]|nr:sulfatase-like hydrolase/transferase [Sedimentisphaerales bacterium]
MGNLNRRDFLKTVAGGAAAMSVPTVLGQQAAADEKKTVKPHNVLFVAFDDLRPQLGCYGDVVVKSPNIDRLAARGMVFDRTYCQQSLCAPSRASLMTGRRVDTVQLWDCSSKHFRDTLPDVVTLPQHFKNNGYFTQNIGKIYHNWHWHIQGDPQSWSVPAMMHWDRHDTEKPQLPAGQPVPPNLATDPLCECRDVPDEAYFDGRIADLSIKALRERAAAQQPFFLAVGFWKPHTPFNAPKRYWDLYQRNDIPVPLPAVAAPPKDAPALALHPSHEMRGVPADYNSRFMSENPPDLEHEMRAAAGYRSLDEKAERELCHGYYAGISYADAQFGKVLNELDRLGLADNTIVVVWGDNGFHLGEETLWGKMSNFELGARVPLIIAAPGVTPANTTTTAMTEFLDLYPTLVELCGLPKATGLEGVSQLPVLKNPKAAVRSCAGTQHPRPSLPIGQPWPTIMGYSIRTGRWRYTEWRDWKTAEV